MRPVLSIALLTAALSVAGATSAQNRPSLGDLVSGVTRGVAAIQRPDPEAAPATGSRPEAVEPGRAAPVAPVPANLGQVDHTAPAAASGSRRAGFAPEEVEIETRSGGPVHASTLGRNCVGMISTAPNYAFTYTAGSEPLYMRVWSPSGNTSLVVRNPNGHYDCDDNYSGLNPAIRWDRPTTGTYHIWVGAVDGPAPATLRIAERS